MPWVTPNCTCTVWDDGAISPDEQCPDHGREAMPAQWAVSDVMERDYVLGYVASLVRNTMRGIADHQELVLGMYAMAEQAVAAELPETARWTTASSAGGHSPQPPAGVSRQRVPLLDRRVAYEVVPLGKKRLRRKEWAGLVKPE
jgi:hypothetical protein